MNLITRTELESKLRRADDFRLVMTHSSFAYRAKHIPTSLHFETPEEALAVIDPSDEVVVYCAGVYCPASIRAYRLFERHGYNRVRRYAGGIDDWEEAGCPVDGGAPVRPMASDEHASRLRGLTRATPSWAGNLPVRAAA
jgi:rhodanese-related sulfurtransferase